MEPPDPIVPPIIGGGLGFPTPRLGTRYVKERDACNPFEVQQLRALPNNTMTEFDTVNPKRAGTKSHERFEAYRTAKNLGDAYHKGMKWEDLVNDFERHFVRLLPAQQSASVNAVEHSSSSPSLDDLVTRFGFPMVLTPLLDNTRVDAAVLSHSVV